MDIPIAKAAVLGAGTMGARIAAHLANAGIPVRLLDMVSPGAASRNQIAVAGLEAAKKSKPASFFEPSLARFITIGNFEDDLDQLAEVDWIIEAVSEDLAIKRKLLSRVEKVRSPETMITTNTSGLSIGKIAEGFSAEFRRCWFGTHFFNPPRYMRLLEIIPTPETDPALVEALARFCDLRLGKGIVRAKDTPNFIANRIGTFSVMNLMRVMREMDLSVEQIDALTGSALGWPRSATFRTIDLVGLDVLLHVARNFFNTAGDERRDLKLPEFLPQMLEKRLLGEKTGGGFYRKAESVKTGYGQQEAQPAELLVLDWKSLEYRPRQKASFPALEMAKNIEDTRERVRFLLSPILVQGSAASLAERPAKDTQAKDTQAKDPAAAFYWRVLSELWTYAANRIPEISDSIADIDRAMRLGFNWELGPFELWDAAGVHATVERMRAEGRSVSPNAEKLLAAGKTTWYYQSSASASGQACFDFVTGDYSPINTPEGLASVAMTKNISTAGTKSRGVVKKNAGASLLDLGDGVGCIEFHSKMNTLGGDVVQLITQTLRPVAASQAGRENAGAGNGDGFEAFVIHNDAANFSAGANLMLLLISIEDEDWDEVDLAIRSFQGMTQAIKFSSRPVVAAPCGMTLGGGAELCLHAAQRNPHAELYMGLVEAGVGLLPGGGGSKEMLLRALNKDSAAQVSKDTAAAQSAGSHSGSEALMESLMESMQRNFETVAMAKVSTSANEARTLGFLHASDSVTMNRERVLSDAKARALELVRSGYQAPIMRSDIAVPGQNILAALRMGIDLMKQRGAITDHDARVSHKIAEVLCGGSLPAGTTVSEQYLLDLEREAFKSLCGERKTQERIRYTLKTGKPLRN